MARSRLRFQESVRRTMKRSVESYGFGGRAHLATVLGTVPVVAEMHESDIPLEEDENLYLSQAVRQYDADYEIEVSDNLVVVMVGEGVWHAVAVFSENDVEKLSAVMGVGEGVAGLFVRDGALYFRGGDGTVTLVAPP